MQPLIIAHRGASGYLPEHTLQAKALGYAMGADYLEQDVVATRDDALVVLHDIYLDRVSDVAARFPGRCREDGRYYVRDFDLDELLRLDFRERVDESGKPVYPQRFPLDGGRFKIHTLADELAFVNGLNRATGGNTGVYPEIKRPAWHRQQGIDIAPRFLEVLAAHGYADSDDRIYVQCFDAAELRRLRRELGCSMRLVQLIGESDWQESDTDYAHLRTEAGLADLAADVDAIGPWLRQLYVPATGAARPATSGLAERAHRCGLQVHPYTFRADELPEDFTSFEELIRFFALEIGIDGLFTDFPDKAARILAGLPEPSRDVNG